MSTSSVPKKRKIDQPSSRRTTIGGTLLRELVEALETDSELADRLRAVLAPRQATSDEWIALSRAGVSVRTLRKAIARGDFEAATVGREYRVRRAALDEWLAGKRNRFAAPPRRRAHSAEAPASEVPPGFAHLVATGQVRLVR